MEATLVTKRPIYWPKWMLIAGIVWAVFILTAGALSDQDAETYTYLVAIVGSGLYTVLLAWTRGLWMPLFTRRPYRGAIILSSLNAAVIETWFLVVERAFGAEGIAAHPNLLLDLIITMPWYIGMAFIFVAVQHRWRFNAVTVLLLGGVYEIGADGFVGAIFSGALFNPAYPLLVALIAYWEFILVYSSMVLPPAWVIDTTPAPPRPTDRVMWRDALRPLLWVIPFSVYVLVLVVLIGVLSELT